MSAPLVVQLAATDYAFRVHLSPLVQALAGSGFDVVCAGPPGPFAADLRVAGLRYEQVPLYRSGNPLVQLRALAALDRLFRRLRPSVVHTHTAAAGLIGRIAATTARVPTVIHTIHGIHVHPGMHPAAAGFFVGAERLGAALSDALFVQNGEDRKVAAAWRTLPCERVLNIGNGIDLKRFDPSKVSRASVRDLRRDLDLPEDAQVVLYVARPTLDKGAGDVLDLSRRLSAMDPPVYIVCVVPEVPGDRTFLRERLIAAEGADRRRVLGFRDDMPALLAMADVLVLPSRYEGLSRVIMEAMAMGRPVVASDVRGCRELVRHGETGLLATAGDVGSLTAAVARVLTDASLRAAMGSAARAHAVEFHDQERTLRMQVQTIRELVDARRTP